MSKRRLAKTDVPRYLRYIPSLLGMPRGHCPDLAKFWVVSCYFNPCNYTNRASNYLRFAEGLRKQNVNLLMVQLRRHSDEVTIPAHTCTKVVDVIEPDVLWAKERLLNIALKSLPPECTQVCWCDCDILFGRDDWAMACSHLLEYHKVLQPFQEAIFLAPNETPQNHTRFLPNTSFAYRHAQRRRQGLFGFASHHQQTSQDAEAIYSAHPGYAWAAQREVLERINGLCDICIMGHGDLVMALAFTHDPALEGPLPDQWTGQWEPAWSNLLKLEVRRWQQHASEVVAGDVIACLGRIYHLWHGPKRARQYHQRAHLLCDFNPARHLQRSPGSDTWQWTPLAKSIGLDQRAEAYFAKRNEDTNSKV